MKQKKDNGQKKENKILQYIVLGCVLLVTGVSVLAGGYLRSLNKEAETDLTGQEETEILVKEAGAVSAEEAMSRNFLNRDPLAVAEGDTREVIRIVEVIPHEICSVFPYLVEWGSKEEYDRQTPLGYEGIRYAATVSGLDQFSDQGVYSFIESGNTSETLTNYNVTFTSLNMSSSTPYWWRVTECKNDVPVRATASGYFEYVGEGKGLYNVNLNYLVDESDKASNDEYGIRYRIMAMERKGSETPKGEWQVNEPAYYWSQKLSNTTYPTTDIKQITGYNYDLKFEKASEKDSEHPYQYRAKDVAVKLEENVVDGNDYEYQATLKDGVSWDDGYVFWEKGNYSIQESSLKENYVVKAEDLENDMSALEGKYIRISSDKKSDGLGGFDTGYFRLFNLEKDKDKMKAGDILYNLKFEAVTPGEGMYVLNPATVSSTDEENLVFEYIGEDAGTCAVTFICVPESGTTQYNGTLYNAEILKVTDGDGDYALTSCAESDKELYVEVDTGVGDYSKVVTAIDCAGIDFTETNNTDASPSGYYKADGKGVCMGCERNYLYFVDQEHGAWVFHTVDSDEINGITKIEELENGSIPSNKRIYVYNQNRYYRYYAQNGFKSNEWFKLLIYMSDDTDTKGLAEDDYAAGKTGQEIVAKYQERLDEFDKSYRIEIIQRTPSELTVSEVESADLIYISDQEGIYGLGSRWDDVNNFLGGTLPDKPYEIKFTDDFSGEVLMAIYDKCLYHEEGETPETALIVANIVSIRSQCMSGHYTTNNMGKLHYLLDFFYDPADFAHFIEGYPENAEHTANEEGYSTIHIDENASVTVYPNGESGNVYNQGIYNYEKYKSWLYNQPIEPQTYDQWFWGYFEVRALVDHDTYIEVLNESPIELGLTYRGLGGHYYNDEWTVYKRDVQDGWTWFAPVTAGNNFVGYQKMHNIWKIMHQRTSKKTSSPQVVVTNSDYMRKPDLENAVTEYYFYVDEYLIGRPEEFTIDYKVLWTPEEVTNPSALTTLTVTRSDGGVIQSEASPAYQTTYSCNVAGDFLDAEGKWNGIRSRQYLITATDTKDKSNTVSVYVIFRDSFMLN